MSVPVFHTKLLVLLGGKITKFEKTTDTSKALSCAKFVAALFISAPVFEAKLETLIGKTGAEYPNTSGYSEINMPQAMIISIKAYSHNYYIIPTLFVNFKISQSCYNQKRVQKLLFKTITS